MNLALSAAFALRAARKALRKEKAKRLSKKQVSNKVLIRKADVAFSLLIRLAGHCQSGRQTHAGPLQCAHGFSRRYHATRWNPNNAWCLCAGCHVYFTHRPIEWDEWMREKMLPAAYEAMRKQALNGGKQDVSAILGDLKLDLLGHQSEAMADKVVTLEHV